MKRCFFGFYFLLLWENFNKGAFIMENFLIKAININWWRYFQSESFDWEFLFRDIYQGDFYHERFLWWNISIQPGISLQSMASPYSQWHPVTVHQIFPVSATTLNVHICHPKTAHVNLHLLTPRHVDYAQVLDSTIRASPPHLTRLHRPVSSLRSATNSATGAQHAQSPSKMTTWK